MCQDTICIPVDGVGAAGKVSIRYSPLPRRLPFNPGGWQCSQLTDYGSGWFGVDLSSLGLADRDYEYEFVVERPDAGDPERRSIVACDPYAKELTRYARTRGVFCIQGGKHVIPSFDWSAEGGLTQLPRNEELVIYELPMRWVDAAEEGYARQVGLGTFDKATNQYFDHWGKLGINCIELTPVQDSPDTLNWGYGTRFFFAPDLDMGGPYDLKTFILKCHRAGIRVILDVVMNHSRGCPLEDLAFDRFYLGYSSDPAHPLKEEDKEERKRPDWGGRTFRYAHTVNGTFWGRDFQYGMANFWVAHYHMDGFRIDEFNGIDNWDFLHEFTRNAHASNDGRFPGRPFLVIAEDSGRRPQAASKPYKNTSPVVDAIWDFDFQDGLRKLVTNTWHTDYGNPPDGRRELVAHLLRGDCIWNEGDKKWRGDGFTAPTQRIIYPTSHDVEGWVQQRLWGFLLEHAEHVTGDESIPGIVRTQAAMEMQVAAFALTCTAVGVPMFLAGEEFAEAHDVAHGDWRFKMSDVIDWYRSSLPGHCEVLRRVKELVGLRAGKATCLCSGRLEFFGFPGNDGCEYRKGFHPGFNENAGERVFAFCRPGNLGVGGLNQVIVVANCGVTQYDSFVLNSWPWGLLALAEVGAKGQPLPQVNGNRASLTLNPFQVRVFKT